MSDTDWATLALLALRQYSISPLPVYLKNAAALMLKSHGVDRAWWMALKQRAATGAILPTDEDEATTRIRRMLGLEKDGGNV